MKLVVLLLSFLSLTMGWPPTGHSARHRHGLSGHCPAARRRPVRVLRTPNATDRPKIVRPVAN